jgi:hypothetical protein
MLADTTAGSKEHMQIFEGWSLWSNFMKNKQALRQESPPFKSWGPFQTTYSPCAEPNCIRCDAAGTMQRTAVIQTAYKI